MSKDAYNENSVDAVLARMEERQKANGEKLDRFLDTQKTHGERITALEGWRIWIVGFAAAVTVLWTVIVDGLKKFFSGH
jgi:hypothetical protein